MINTYGSDLRKILFHPRAFFREMPVSGGMGGPLAFALVTHWLGSALHYLEELWIGGPFAGWFGRLFHDTFQTLSRALVMNSGSIYRYSYVSSSGDPLQQSRFMALKDRIYDWFMGAGPVIVDPFFNLFSILFTSVLVLIGARLLISYPPERLGRRGVSYESVVRISCFSLAASLLLCVPVFGKVIASCYTLILLIIGTQEVYEVGMGKAVVIALFPRILFFGMLMTGFLFIAFIFINLISMLF